MRINDKVMAARPAWEVTLMKMVRALAIAAALAAPPLASRPALAAPLPATAAINDAAKAIGVTAKARCGLAWRCNGEICRERAVCWAPTRSEYRSCGYRAYGIYRPHSYFGPYEHAPRPYWAYRPWADEAWMSGPGWR